MTTCCDVGRQDLLSTLEVIGGMVRDAALGTILQSTGRSRTTVSPAWVPDQCDLKGAYRDKRAGAGLQNGTCPATSLPSASKQLRRLLASGSEL